MFFSGNVNIMLQEVTFDNGKVSQKLEKIKIVHVANNCLITFLHIVPHNIYIKPMDFYRNVFY